VRHVFGPRPRLAIAVALGTLLVASVAAPSSAAVGSWGHVKQLSNTAKSSLADAEMRAKYVVVGQVVPAGSSGNRLRIIRSTNAGNSFLSPLAVRAQIRQPSVAVCGDGTPVAVYGHQISSGWVVEQSIRTGGDGWARRVLTSGNEYPHHPESVCGADPSVVWSAWLSRSGSSGPFSVKVVRAASTDSGLPESIIVGTAGTKKTGPVLTAIPNGVAVAWQGPNGDIQTRNVVFSGSLAMTTLINLGLGTTNRPAADPAIASFNQRVVVAWDQCNDVFARVSTNAGTSWANARKLAGFACPGQASGTPNSAAVRVQNMAVGYTVEKPSTGRERIVTTGNAFAKKANANVTGKQSAFIVGYVLVKGDVRLAVVYDNGPALRFRRCSTQACGPF
jgi:hypothetical protein